MPPEARAAPDPEPGSADAQPAPALSAFDVSALIVGIVVGAGIFRTPGEVAEATGSLSGALLAWTLGGVVSLVGALCYVELATTYPHAGGEYHYLRRAFGSGLGFLFVWARLTVIQSGSVAMLAFLLGDYAVRLFPFLPLGSGAYAAAAVVALTGVNLLGLRLGKTLQALLAWCIVLSLLLVIGSGLFGPAAPARPTAPAGETAFGLAMVFVLLTYGGWNEASYVSAEVRSGPRALRRALLGGVGAVTALYLLTNVAFFRGLGFGGVAGSETVAADLVGRALGVEGAILVSAFVVMAALSTMNGTIITGARSAFALGRDFDRLSFLGRWRTAAGTPAPALVAQGLLAVALVAVGAAARRGFETMVSMTAPVFWLFFLLVGVALLVLRHRDPGAPRPFRVPLYPLTPLLFCGSCAYMLFASVAHTGAGALVGLTVLALGLPVLRAARRGLVPGPA